MSCDLFRSAKKHFPKIFFHAAHVERGGNHFPGGNRYWRVTSAKADMGDKLLYETDKIDWRLDENSFILPAVKLIP